MDINKLGYAAVMYFSENKEIVFFETSKGYLLNNSVSVVSKLLRSSLLKPKSKQVEFERNNGILKIFIDQGFGAKKEINFQDISHEHQMDTGMIFIRML